MVLEPAEQPANLGAQNSRVPETRKKRFHSIEHDALRADALHRMLETDKQTLEVVLAGLFDLGGLDIDVIHEELFGLHEMLQIEAK